jgi:hypothetical protein
MLKKRKVEEETEAVTDVKSLAIPREQSFALYSLGSRDGVWSATRAGYHGDLAKRSRNLLKREDLQAFLTKYGSEANDYKLDITQEAVLQRLSEIASKKLEKVTTQNVLEALKMVGSWLSMWDGQDMKAGKDKLDQLIAVFQAGPVKDEKKEANDEKSSAVENRG